ncbi:aminotransferase class V-fold PLP-dependent enzyme [Limnoglobus roseus]|uniref:Aminotransferase class V-fold PLP-dependent enzyme n=1 Tax=Limnoglobus roseus TaxID=2598579 RepID=A0A5C1AEZ7_9BACT|nr:aminotransferase class V-fold PLP-dependent enzyme [Limnoglobus roseus]QEL17999.1 aminotransferase class V-fold PLP-dependent enzyme [Limnoglobus roseus]
MPAILGSPPAFPDGPPPWPPPNENVAAAVQVALASGRWGQYHGPCVATLETQLTATFGVPHAITCASGTLAVEAALRSVGVAAGDEVILAAYEYESNFLTLHALGAKPVLVDVSPGNWNLDPAQLATAIGPKTKAILVSHLHSGLVPMNAVLAVADAHGIAVVEDAAQCPGATIGPRQCGSFGSVGTLSFGGSKLLSAGRGGALLFRESRAYQRAKLWLNRGVQPWAPLSELQATVVLPQLANLDADTQRRLASVQFLRERPVPGLQVFDNGSAVQTPAFYKAGFRYDPAAFGLPRELFCRAMRAEGIAFDVGFKALHLGRSPSRFRAVGDLAEATRASENCVKLHHPVLLHPPDVLERVARTIENVYRNAVRIRAAFPPS